jgi:hypothetical protein
MRRYPGIALLPIFVRTVPYRQLIPYWSTLECAHSDITSLPVPPRLHMRFAAMQHCCSVALPFNCASQLYWDERGVVAVTLVQATLVQCRVTP